MPEHEERLRAYIAKVRAEIRLHPPRFCGDCALSPPLHRADCHAARYTRREHVVAPAYVWHDGRWVPRVLLS